jgi:hypothetical protein
MNNRLSREEVFNIINKEREHQEKKWGIKHDDNHPISDWLIFMRKYLNEAENALYESNCDGVMTAIKKITLLGVAAMESKGDCLKDK